METEKNSQNFASCAVFTSFADVAARAAASAGARLGMASASAEGSGRLMALPSLDDSFGRKLLLPAWRTEGSRLATRMSAWGYATADDDTIALELRPPVDTDITGRLLERALTLALVACVSEACGHPMAAADRERADDAEDRLIMSLAGNAEAQTLAYII